MPPCGWISVSGDGGAGRKRSASSAVSPVKCAKAGSKEVTVDLEKLRKELTDYLDNYAKNEAPFPNKDRPLELKKLRVVALVQNDKTREILNATQVEVGEEK